MSIAFYDHELPSEKDPNRGVLRGLVGGLGWAELPRVPQDKCGGRDLAEAICRESWEVGFLHISAPHSWQAVCGCIERDRVIVRVSTQGFDPAEPELQEPLVLRLVPKMDRVSVSEWEVLAAGLQDRSTVEALRRGDVPDRLRKYFAFRTPLWLVALWIYGVAWMTREIERAPYAGSQPDAAVVKAAKALLGDVGWTGAPRELKAMPMPPLWEVFGSDDLVEQLKRELELGYVPEWVKVLSDCIRAKQEPSMVEMTEALEELGRELRITRHY